ncbi:hypothetical protein SAMN05421734_102321 [Pelagirhabdus alkalitolerans]|uniref:UPF0178 protein SAMN05421734_102321 n=1 Tax=Pelagirhabdus alkalitolerans TaxID=1612202 RepID=A0A1G6H729_9BACI|nr:YaiI/YqxD family protein [Pelagirhabdus alkalitolerans]SDB90070.1 hypothetical protein SAMN05421734_102321 [Pelagirhabdus alkalitolerans]
MIIYVDADASPVTQDIIDIANTFKLHVRLIKSYAHYSDRFNSPLVEEIYVDSHNEAADYKIIQLIQPGDILITQDYGLASLVLPKGCQVIHPRGSIYKAESINHLLESRYLNSQIRKQGGKTKGPSRFTETERQAFILTLENVIESELSER